MSAYMLAVCDITNMTDDMKTYMQKSSALIQKNGGEYLIRGKAAENCEGDRLDGPVVILTRFPNMEKLKAYWEGPEYAEIKHLRDGTGTYHISIFEAAPG